MRMMVNSTQTFSEFFTNNYAQVMRFVERRITSREDAQDVTAEIFHIAWHKWAELTAPDMRWLASVARWKIRDYNKALARRLRKDEALQLDALLSGESLPVDDAHMVRQMVAALPTRQREVMQLLHWERLSPPEIAEHLGCSVESVWKASSRAFATLRTKLRDVHTSEEGESEYERTH